MRGGIFDRMTLPKKVSFIERVSRSVLGLDGLQIIVDADDMTGNGDVNQFDELGREVINSIDGHMVMKQYGIVEGRAIANKLHEERVAYLKNKFSKYGKKTI